MSELVYECGNDECDRQVRRYTGKPEKDCRECGPTTWEMVPQ